MRASAITFFEITAAAMFLAFSRHPADAVVLEVGLGGNYDATNVVPKPAMTMIQPVGMDHSEFLGDDIAAIAGEKAGIIKKGSPLVVGPQNAIARHVILRQADRLSAPAFVFGQDFFGRQEHGRMVYEDETGLLDLPLPRLVGRHQIENAGVAIAALAPRDARRQELELGPGRGGRAGLATVEWPGRLQQLHQGPADRRRAQGRGGLAGWRPQSAWRRGRVARHGRHGGTWRPAALSDLRHALEQGCGGLLCGLQWPGAACGDGGDPGRAEQPGRGCALRRRAPGGLDSAPAEDLEDAMLQVAAWTRLDAQEPPPRILICGSLYLAGKVLAENG